MVREIRDWQDYAGLGFSQQYRTRGPGARKQPVKGYLVSGDSGPGAGTGGQSLRGIGWHFTDYLPDAGCDLNPSCLSCPHPLCAEDVGIIEARGAAIAAGTLTPRTRPEGEVLPSPNLPHVWDKHLPEITRLYASGATIPSIAAATGLSITSVRAATATLGRRTKPQLTDVERLEIKRLQRDGASIKDIARTVGVSVSTVKRINGKQAA